MGLKLEVVLEEVGVGKIGTEALELVEVVCTVLVVEVTFEVVVVCSLDSRLGKGFALTRAGAIRPRRTRTLADSFTLESWDWCFVPKDEESRLLFRWLAGDHTGCRMGLYLYIQVYQGRK